MTRPKVALVTGGNRGIGHAVARRLASVEDLQVVVTARSSEKAQEAARSLSAVATRPVVAKVLDVRDLDRASALVSELDAELGGVDILVNNAGVALDKFESGFDVPMQKVRETLETNVMGALAMIQAVVPLMRRDGYGRIVNVSSELGSLSEVKLGTTLAYRMSKATLNAMTVYLAAELKDEPILINSAAPGWCRTELGGEGAPRSAEDGADTIVWLATIGDDGPRGAFFRDRQPHPW